MYESNAAENIEEAVEAPVKRVRKPKLDAEGQPIVKAVRTPKEPKPPKLWPQWNEDGTPLLDSEGQQVMLETRMKKPKAPKAQRLDADGNPIARTVTVLSEDQVISFTEKGKTTKYREGTNRAKHFESIFEGMTVGQYYEANGGKSACFKYLVHQLNKMGTIEIN